MEDLVTDDPRCPPMPVWAAIIIRSLRRSFELSLQICLEESEFLFLGIHMTWFALVHTSSAFMNVLGGDSLVEFWAWMMSLRVGQSKVDSTLRLTGASMSDLICLTRLAWTVFEG